MKLKNVLILAFLSLTLIPTFSTSLLLYKSGYNLSEESYRRNLIESINVQSDYISQTIEQNMIGDSRFVGRNFVPMLGTDIPTEEKKAMMLTAFQNYLDLSEDRITACLYLDTNGEAIYSIGESVILEIIKNQLPELELLLQQTSMEFQLGENQYHLGTITPIRDRRGVYHGSLVAIYDKSYIFKILSSYYKVSDSSTYICTANGDIISTRATVDAEHKIAIENAFTTAELASQGELDTSARQALVSAYYKKIYNTPWYMVGFVDHSLIADFMNQFIWVYLLIIVVLLTFAVVLSIYFSQKVVAPINSLIAVIDGYPNSVNMENSDSQKSGYVETRYLHTKFFGLMRTILRVQHNFSGVYQLYQSNSMGDINIDIDVKKQTIQSNKPAFQHLFEQLEVPEGVCIVERFTRCFCEKDQHILLNVLENMRDEHLSVAREIEIYTTYLNEMWFHSLIVPMYEADRLSRLFVQLRDISSFKRQEVESLEQARRDSLTGLLNRIGFSTCVEKALSAGTPDDLHGLLFIDMNYFKLVNDNLGHSAGDDLLRLVGVVLLESIGVQDIASRFGGDEFAIFLPRTSLEAMTTVKETLSKQLVYPFETKSGSFTVSASIGMSTWKHDTPDTLEKLLKQADSSMYQAKREFKKSFTENAAEFL